MPLVLRIERTLNPSMNTVAQPQDTESPIRVSFPQNPLLLKALKRTFRGTRVHPMGVANNTLQKLLPRRKDVTPYLERSGVVYQIPCSDPGCSSSYVGQTKRTLLHRIREHKLAVRQGDTEKSALALHLTENPGHDPAWDEIKILYNSAYYHERLLKESWAIQNTNNINNRRQERQGLPGAYATVLRAHNLRQQRTFLHH